jgi:hypothetical protein
MDRAGSSRVMTGRIRQRAGDENDDNNDNNDNNDKNNNRQEFTNRIQNKKGKRP